MLLTDFQDIIHFKPVEITRTGAKLEDVQFKLIHRYDIFREIIESPVLFLLNGFTSGEHESPGHKLGLAADCALYFPKECTNEDIFKAALKAGFKKIGIYWTGKRYTFHLEISNNFSFWSAVLVDKNWQYHSLLMDPKNLI